MVKANIATSVNQSRANPLSEVQGIANAYYEEGFDLEELLLITGKSSGWIEDRLLISQASPVVKQCLEEGRITIGVATLLAGVVDLNAQEEALHLQLAHGWTVRELEDHLRGTAHEGSPGEGNRQSTPRTQTRRAQSCNLCQVEHDPSEVQKITVCNGCAGSLGSSAATGEGEIAVPSELLREAEGILAGSQEGAPLAERIAVLVEGAAGHEGQSEEGLGSYRNLLCQGRFSRGARITPGCFGWGEAKQSPPEKESGEIQAEN